MVLLQKLWVIRFAYRMMVRSLPLLTGVAVLATCSLTSRAASNPALIKGVTFSTSADSSPSGLAAIANSPVPSSEVTHSPEADDRIERADRHFNAGRELYFQG